MWGPTARSCRRKILELAVPFKDLDIEVGNELRSNVDSVGARDGNRPLSPSESGDLQPAGDEFEADVESVNTMLSAEFDSIPH